MFGNRCRHSCSLKFKGGSVAGKNYFRHNFCFIEILYPGRNYIRPPPPPPVFWPKGIFQWRGVGVYILRPHAAGILYARPPFIHPPPLGGHFQGWGGWGCIKFGPVLYSIYFRYGWGQTVTFQARTLLEKPMCPSICSVGNIWLYPPPGEAEEGGGYIFWGAPKSQGTTNVHLSNVHFVLREISALLDPSWGS